jgi:hypothetical protein
MATFDYLGTEHWQSLYHMPSPTQYHSNISQTGCDSDHAKRYYIATICNWLKYFYHFKELIQLSKGSIGDTLSRTASQAGLLSGKS